MTMCALDTRNNGRRDTNAVINVLLQFSSLYFLPFFCSFPILILEILFLQMIV